MPDVFGTPHAHFEVNVKRDHVFSLVFRVGLQTAILMESSRRALSVDVIVDGLILEI